MWRWTGKDNTQYLGYDRGAPSVCEALNLREGGTHATVGMHRIVFEALGWKRSETSPKNWI